MAADAPAVRPDAVPGRARRVASWLHARPRARLWLLLAVPLTWLVVVYLGSLAILLLNAFWTSGRVHRQGQPLRLVARGVRADHRQRRLPDHRPADARHGRARHRHRRPARLPDRLLHGPGGQPPNPSTARRGDPHAAVGVVPREDLRLAHDLPGQRVPLVDARAIRDRRARAPTRSRTRGSSSATCGCRT